MTEYMRYRDFIVDLETTAAEDDTMRVLENRYLAETCDTWLSLVPGRDGGVALIRSRKNGKPPADAGATVKIDPTVMLTALAAALSTDQMMRLARSILAPRQIDPSDAVTFATGLQDLPTNPFGDDEDAAVCPPPATKPPSLDTALWKQIPHALRRDYIKRMAMGIRRGIHPDDTVSELLASETSRTYP
ncbi:hypothetical protein [Rhizobium sp. Root1220]|uniref:hypothetical protein n=1 Tax=Rhizobium sp. Root1220 TaxID=1736432 RepID=UPI0006F33ACB|nr:hypothetical protein [Rhizobium sp. Root1220]KQV79985.1 hypothetical protein ASC90_25625 [Rhizobium sp. Root1220]